VQPAAPRPTYYVSPTGDDAADGHGPLSAWRTVAKVNSTALAPGAHVLFQRGGEWHETLSVSSSGTPGAPVVFGSYGTGLKPKFWGSDVLDPSLFEPVAGADSTYRIVAGAGRSVNSIQADHAFFFTVYLATSAAPDPASSLAAVKATPRTWFQDAASHDLYVHTAGDDPRAGQVLYTAAVRENPVLVSQQHDVVVRNLVTDESAKFGGGYGFYVGESTNITLEGCEAYRAGKHHFGAINTDNFVGRDLYAAWAMPNQGYGGASAYVTYSDFHRPDSRSSWYDVAYEELDRATAPYLVFLSHGGGIGDLLVDNVRSRGGIGMSIAPDGGARVRVHGGLLEDVGLSLYAANAVVDGLTLRGPRVGLAVLGSGDVVQNVLIDGARPDFADAAVLVNYGSGNTFRFNTVRIAPDTGWPGAGVAIKTQFGIGPTFYGNIIDAPRAFRVDPGAVPAFVSDHNLFARDPFFIRSDGTALDLGQWRAERGQELNSSVGDPMFADPAGGDFTPLPGSPAVDAFTPGGAFEGITTDLLGAPRPRGPAYDLGAVESAPGTGAAGA
jgi:hypothetical protein